MLLGVSSSLWFLWLPPVQGQIVTRSQHERNMRKDGGEGGRRRRIGDGSSEGGV